jgi:hypothetical protein
VGGRVALEVNGVTVCGPVAIPAELLGSPVHGVQMDVFADESEGVGTGLEVRIDSDMTPLTERPSPTIRSVGTAVEANASTINVDYPTGIQEGDLLLALVTTKNGGAHSATGWTLVTSNFGIVGGTLCRGLMKVATGTESGSLTINKSTSGIQAGCMLVFDGATVGGMVSMAGQGNNVVQTSMPAPTLRIYGPRRTLLWVGATSIDTDITIPAGFIPLSTGVSGGQAIRMAIGGQILDSHPDNPGPPFNSYAASHMPAQVGTAATATTNSAGYVQLDPVPL